MDAVPKIKWFIGLVSMLLSIPSNCILIFLVITKSPEKMGNYRHLMCYFSIMSMVVAVLNGTTQLYILSENRFVMVMNLEDTFLENHPKVALWILGLTCASFQAIFVVTSINFIFRYFALERQGRLKYFAGKRLLLWITAPWVMGAMSMISTILMGPTESMTERLRPDLLRRFNLNIDKTTYSGCFYYTIDEFGNSYINWRELWYLSLVNVMIWVSLYSILYFGYKSYKIVKGLIAQGENEYSRNLQTQLYKALVAQVIDKGYRSVTIHSDSQFVQDAITGSGNFQR
ncbi:hypothetical protein L5515_010495 [Caenorhabditis briggsae]|uniref:Uncharacterized protein n=1 Tax=Caenorhabditis briggsae TaxID=6238 RepID=A0AAE9ES75_CAEBR|nr:hypothetical protein L5515_010495 [Caenorhabditis briggsae]